jgi:hypothetical protein
MGAKPEYDFYVRRLIPASVAGFAIALLFCLSTAEAQVHGVPTSVTSIGFGGHFDRAPGIPASVTSLGPRGFADPSHTFTGLAFQPRPGQMFVHRHRHDQNFPTFGQVYAVPYYVPVPVVDPTASDDSMEMQESTYPSGPTIFDRRASGQSSKAAEAAYAERMLSQPRREPAPQPSAAPVADAVPLPDQPSTVLVFKDGHRLEVQNYAIVGSMLYDLTPGHRSRIALTDLDLASTAKRNDDRGIDFQLPVRSETN